MGDDATNVRKRRVPNQAAGDERAVFIIIPRNTVSKPGWTIVLTLLGSPVIGGRWPLPWQDIGLERIMNYLGTYQSGGCNTCRYVRYNNTTLKST